MDFDQLIDREGSQSLKYGARKAVFGREDVIPLWVADMDFAAPEAVTQALIERAQHPIYGYSQFDDSVYQSLIDWCQRRYHWQIEQKQILMCPGVVPSLHVVIEALTKAGDSVIVQPPVYFPFFSTVTDTGRNLVLNQLKLVNGEYRMDLMHLEKCASEGGRMLLLCSPHNPVGRVWSRQELLDLADIARRYDMTIVSDEIHADLIYAEHIHTPLASLVDDVEVITALSPSKTFNIPGLGLSSLVVKDKTHRRAIQRVFDRQHVSASNPFSITAFVAAYTQGEDWLTQLMPYLQQTRDQVEQYFATAIPQIKLIQPQGSYLLWLDCRALDIDDAELKQLFIEQAGVGLSPGTLFGDGGRGFMRMNIAAPRSVILQALQQIKHALEQPS